MLRDDILAFEPFNEQEMLDKEQILYWLDNAGDVFTRLNRTVHMTASAWVVSPDRKHVLMAWHNLYRSWAWLGGHADGEENLLSVAQKELFEESGVTGARPVTEKIFSLEVLTVDGHEKRGQYVSSHLHLNVTYLFEADMNSALSVKPDENSAVGWIAADDLKDKVTEPWMMERIYEKLCQKAVLA